MNITRNQNGDIVIPVALMKEILNSLPSDVIRGGLETCHRMCNDTFKAIPVLFDNYALKKCLGESQVTWKPEDVRAIYIVLGQPVNEDLLGVDNPFYIERSLRSDYAHLTISDDGILTRPWRQDEIDLINTVLNN